ncbi:DNA repair protein RAD51 homolog 4 isoform X1 [Drosophila takahashii]|uniref:DNA repair protein RAD51 homolog 4 isoform X1 n=1 Tax=Drosophila takahashii TaxID=29030 RepID=UPI001CF881AA|nr:DNA repair protein RAD51 homolog 4 [Drosophila takahashii]
MAIICLRYFRRYKQKKARKMDLQLMILETSTGKLLSEYQLNLLSKNNIESLIDFYEADEEKLHELLLIEVESVRVLKKELSLLLKKSEEECTLDVEYGTGIEELDKLLDSVEQHFKPGRIWELCGQTGVGKTQVMYTLALNFVWKHALPVLFIDTKRDFSCHRIEVMLRARNTDSETSGRAMKDIQVAQAPTAADLINVLETFDQQLIAKMQAAVQTKFVLIDSLAACFAHYRGRRMQLLRQSLLVELACKIRKLAFRGVAFLIGNVSFFGKDGIKLIRFYITKSTETIYYVALTDNGFDDGEDNGNNEDTSTSQQLEPMLGAYWSSVCTLRLSLELPVEEDITLQDDGRRLLHVISNTYGPVGDHCLLRIAEAGVI